MKEEEIFDLTEQEFDELCSECKKLIIERQMAEDLKKIRELDANIEDLAMLGDEYAELIADGVSADEAYRTVKASMEKSKVPVMGDIISRGGTSGDFFTREEVAAMNPAQIKKHYEKVRKSMARWK